MMLANYELKQHMSIKNLTEVTESGKEDMFARAK